jgi:hypothetical protein
LQEWESENVKRSKEFPERSKIGDKKGAVSNQGCIDRFNVGGYNIYHYCCGIPWDG